MFVALDKVIIKMYNFIEEEENYTFREQDESY